MISAPNKRFHKQIALVTGATSGVGRAIALRLAQEGADVALVARRLALLRTVCKECARLGSKASGYQVDLLEDTQIQHLVQRVLADFGAVDMVVHSAGVIALSNVSAASLADFDLQYRSNVRAPFALTQILLPSLISRRGQVVFINSSAGLQAAAGISQYAATKHALKAVADSLREEVNLSGVRVLSVYLGRTATPMQAMIHHFEGKDYQPAQLIQPSQVAALVADALATDREAEITDIRIRPMHKPASSLKANATDKPRIGHPARDAGI